MNFHLLTWFAVFTGILLGSDNGRLSAVLDNSLVKGSVAGFTSAVLLQPFDLIKTRWQERKSDVELPSIREICKKGGIRVLWRGLGTLEDNIYDSLCRAIVMEQIFRARAILRGNGCLPNPLHPIFP